ncbi:LysM peptidoglycan-binding domain-containing protein [Nocardioides cheoyonin]|uniref:LysM peptidoglycan-binding domain-containing protein n=1 Tax=Nocardioides cheoyonin TaxID=3156615 RepID=UPI0032B5F478
MNDTDHPSPLRCLAVWLAATALAVGVAAVLLPVPASPAGEFDDLLVRLCSWALLGCAGWFWTVTTLVVAAALRSRDGRVRSVRGVPAPVRRLVLAACGVALTSSVAAPALATPGPVPVDARDHSGRVVLTGLPYPDRAVAGQAPRAGHGPAAEHAQPPAVRPSASTQRHVVVRPGDSLWSIAESCLPAGASDAEVATAWQELYAANRHVVGADPDLIEPGQRLAVPSSLDHPREPSRERPSEGASS